VSFRFALYLLIKPILESNFGWVSSLTTFQTSNNV
jgi:hypothetical protein